MTTVPPVSPEPMVTPEALTAPKMLVVAYQATSPGSSIVGIELVSSVMAARLSGAVPATETVPAAGLLQDPIATSSPFGEGPGEDVDMLAGRAVGGVSARPSDTSPRGRQR